jgi:hypothetical protein
LVLNRPPDPRPQEPAVVIAAVEHQVGAPRRFELGVGAVLADRATREFRCQRGRRRS